MEALSPACVNSPDLRLEALRQKFSAKGSDYAAWYKYREGKKAGLSDQQMHHLIFGLCEHPYRFVSGSHLRPQDFFGGLIEDYPEGIPDDYATLLADEIEIQLWKHHKPEDGDREIHTFGRVGCEIPTDWHRRLVEKLLAHGIRVDDGARTTLEHPRLFGYNRLEDGTFRNPHADR